MEERYKQYIHDGIATIPFGTRVIEDNAFAFCEELKKVVIPNTVVRIGYAAFSDCYSLIDVEIPNSVKEIADLAFSSCAIERLELPDSVTKIGKNAFSDTPLKNLHVPSGITVIEERVFSSCKELLSVFLPNGINSIQDFAFEGCERLTNINIPDTVCSIGHGAFSGCHALRTLHLPGHLSNICPNAFWACSNIEHISNSSICFSAKGNCIIEHGGNLLFGGKNAVIPSDSNIRVIKQGAFFWSTIESINIPDGVKTIEEDAFNCCKNLKQIKLPWTIESIKGNPFSFCPNLESITVDAHFLNSSYTSEDNCVLDINKTVLYVGCNSSIIPPTVHKISYHAFRGSGIESICVLDGVTAIGPEAFYACERLSHVRLPKTLREYGHACFSGCTALKEIELLIEHPSSIRYWDKYHFFEGLDISKVILYVPIGTGYEYRNDSVFNGFKEIRPVLREKVNIGKTDDSTENTTSLFSDSYPDDLPPI